MRLFQNHQVIVLMGPVALFILVFLASPLANLAALSFLTHSPTQLWTLEFTLGNYRQALDGYYFEVFVKSVRVAGIATFLCFLLGYPLAYYLARCSARALSVGLFLLMMPLMVSTVIRAFGWMIILGNNGLLNRGLQASGFDRISIMYTEAAVIIALVQLVLPLMVLPIMASIENISQDLEEAAINLGCGVWGVFRQVLWPMSLPGITSGAILCFGVSVSVVVTPALLGGRRGRMIGNEIYDQVLTGLNWPFASALSIFLIAGIFAVLGVSSVLLRSGRIKREGAVNATG